MLAGWLVGGGREGYDNFKDHALTSLLTYSPTMITKCVVMCPEGKLDILDKFKMFKIKYSSSDCTC